MQNKSILEEEKSEKRSRQTKKSMLKVSNDKKFANAMNIYKSLKNQKQEKSVLDTSEISEFINQEQSKWDL